LTTSCSTYMTFAHLKHWVIFGKFHLHHVFVWITK
jgi:hypothetical protein